MQSWNGQWFNAAQLGDVESLKALMEETQSHLDDYGDTALCIAAQHGQVDILRLLNPRNFPPGVIHRALVTAIQERERGAVDELMPYADLTFRNSNALAVASQCDWLELVEELAPQCNPEQSTALLDAATGGYLPIVKALVKFERAPLPPTQEDNLRMMKALMTGDWTPTDYLDRTSKALYLAAEMGHLAVVEELYHHCDVASWNSATLQSLPSAARQLIEALLERDRLAQVFAQAQQKPEPPKLRKHAVMDGEDLPTVPKHKNRL